MKPYLASLLATLFLLSHSCSKRFAFEHSTQLPASGWTYENILKFNFEVADTDALYDLYLEIDYLNSFAYQNMYVNVYTGQNETSMKKTQLSLDLSSKLGIWKGKCKGEKCTYLLPLQKSIFFQNTGDQLFWLEQASRQESLKGISGVKLVGEIIGSRKAK